jgi:hypothetical protein
MQKGDFIIRLESLDDFLKNRLTDSIPVIFWYKISKIIE